MPIVEVSGHAATYWRAEGDKVRCLLCPHRCLIADGRVGLCRVRTARKGALEASGYGRVSSVHVDPMEKKPLYHFHPGTTVFSVGGWGCNFRCAFCQNWTISQQAMLQSSAIAPDRLVAEARASGAAGIAYTYNEPLIGFEYVRDCAALARGAGLANVLVTNGYVNPEPASELLPLIDAANVDLKSIDDGFYREHCGGSLAPVQEFIAMAVRGGCHIELTNLVIPGLNDEDRHFESLSEWVLSTVGPAVPLHLSAYHPQYKLQAPPTPADTLDRAHRICARRLRYVYLGNVISRTGRDTACPGCGTVLIARVGYTVRVQNLRGCECARCGRELDIRI